MSKEQRRRRLGYRWRLRERMGERGMHSTSDLLPHLKERGIELSAAQVYRLVAQKPERLNLRVLAALCDALGCAPNDLIEPTVEEAAPEKKAAGGGEPGVRAEDGPRGRRPKRARIVDDDLA